MKALWTTILILFFPFLLIAQNTKSPKESEIQFKDLLCNAKWHLVLSNDANKPNPRMPAKLQEVEDKFWQNHVASISNDPRKLYSFFRFNMDNTFELFTVDYMVKGKWAYDTITFTLQLENTSSSESNLIGAKESYIVKDISEKGMVLSFSAGNTASSDLFVNLRSFGCQPLISAELLKTEGEKLLSQKKQKIEVIVRCFEGCEVEASSDDVQITSIGENKFEIFSESKGWKRIQFSVNCKNEVSWLNPLGEIVKIKGKTNIGSDRFYFSDQEGN